MDSIIKKSIRARAGEQHKAGSANTAPSARALHRFLEKNQRHEAMQVPSNKNQRPRPTTKCSKVKTRCRANRLASKRRSPPSWTRLWTHSVSSPGMKILINHKIFIPSPFALMLAGKEDCFLPSSGQTYCRFLCNRRKFRWQSRCKKV